MSKVPLIGTGIGLVTGFKNEMHKRIRCHRFKVTDTRTPTVIYGIGYFFKQDIPIVGNKNTSIYGN
jgi:hypothetical protein